MRARMYLYCISTLIAGLILLGRIPSTTNCGGNSVALSGCGEYVMAVLTCAADAPGKSFPVTNPSPELREQFAGIAHRTAGIHGAHYLVSTLPVFGKAPPIQRDPANRRILIVCDTSYRNVPQHLLWQAPAAHAVGYSDGTTGLISPSEFAALDRSAFKPLDQLFP